MPKFPKHLFVTHENIGTNEEFLNASADVTALAEIGGKRSVGLYVLKETAVMTTTVNLEKVK